jgi:hypothetical protein
MALTDTMQESALSGTEIDERSPLGSNLSAKPRVTL